MSKKCFFLFFCFVFINFFFISDVSAKETLQRCIYDTNVTLVEEQYDVSNSRYVIYIYSDYSSNSVFEIWKGERRDNNEDVKNWDKIKSNSKSSDSNSAVCPTYAIISKPTAKPSFFRAWAAYTEEEAKKVFKEHKNDGRGKVNCGIVKITTSYNLTGTASVINGKDVTNNNSNNNSSNNGTTNNNGNNNSNNNNNNNNNKNNTFNGNSTERKCDYILGDPSTEGTIAWLIQKIFNYVKILGPILVIVLSGLDFTKTILSSDANEMKKAQKKLFIRLGCAVGIFFLPLIATVLLNLINGTTGDQVCGIK